MKLKHLILLSVICCSQSVFGQKANQQPKTSGNPVFPGWYADPEGVVFGDEYWIYPTYSAPYDEQTFMDAFSSKDLVNWTKHPKVLSKENISWFKRALWAPAVIHANDKYYIFIYIRRIHLFKFIPELLCFFRRMIHGRNKEIILKEFFKSI